MFQRYGVVSTDTITLAKFGDRIIGIGLRNFAHSPQ